MVFATTVQLVLLVPFLNYLFSFLDTEKVATTIVERGINSVVNSINSQKNIKANQVLLALFLLPNF